MTTMTRLAAILGVAVLATACGDFKSMSGPSPMTSASVRSAAIVTDDADDAPTFSKQQTTVGILDGVLGGGTGHSTITYNTGQDPCTLYDFGLESYPSVGVLTWDGPYHHFHQECQYKDGV